MSILHVTNIFFEFHRNFIDSLTLEIHFHLIFRGDALILRAKYFFFALHKQGFRPYFIDLKTGNDFSSNMPGGKTCLKITSRAKYKYISGESYNDY